MASPNCFMSEAHTIRLARVDVLIGIIENIMNIKNEEATITVVARFIPFNVLLLRCIRINAKMPNIGEATNKPEVHATPTLTMVWVMTMSMSNMSISMTTM